MYIDKQNLINAASIYYEELAHDQLSNDRAAHLEAAAFASRGTARTMLIQLFADHVKPKDINLCWRGSSGNFRERVMNAAEKLVELAAENEDV
jgi:hypothetical protein